MKTFLLASGLLAAVGAAPAAAQSTPSLIVEQVKVHYGDLDLAASEGADAMLNRLTEAASKACGGKPRPIMSDPVWSSKQRAYRLCKVSAIDAATLALNAPLVRVIWLEQDDAIRFGEAARRATSDLLQLARLQGTAVPTRNY